MDLTSIASYGLSSCVHIALLVGFWANHEHLEQLLPQSEENAADDNKPIPQQASKQIPVPLSVNVPNRQAQQLAALPIPRMPDADEYDFMKTAIAETTLNDTPASESKRTSGNKVFNLPELSFGIDSIKHDTSAKQKPQKQSLQSGTIIEDFTNIINGAIYRQYKQQWRKRYHKLISNHQLQVLSTVVNGCITDATLIRGSGITEFDERLMRWIQLNKPNGPPQIEDGQYPMIIKLK